MEKSDTMNKKRIGILTCVFFLCAIMISFSTTTITDMVVNTVNLLITGNATISGNINITGTINSTMEILVPQIDTGYSPSGNIYSNGAFIIDNTKNPGNAVSIFSNNGSPSVGANLLLLATMNDSYDRPLLRIIDASESGGAASIRMDSPNPDIELVENDQTSPQGKFELAVQSDRFQINSRNAADNSFENFISFIQKAYLTGGYAIETFTINSTSPVSDYILFNDQAKSAGASHGIRWTNENGGTDLARIDVSAGTSYLVPTINFRVFGIDQMQLQNGKAIFNNTNITGVNYLNAINLTVGEKTGYFLIPTNTSVKTCSATTEGAIYYDGITKKHYGCNSTDWNAFY
jgi:hypothetical protein